MCPGMAASAVSLTKSYDIVILSFCNIVKGQANYDDNFSFSMILSKLDMMAITADYEKHYISSKYI